jgi:predicted Zn-dependent protease
VILPFSRKHELEADRIGIMLMAQAGYDPQAAPRLWEKFASVKKESGPAEFFSTHPSDEHRVEELNEVLAEATQLYQKAPHQFGFGESV